MRSPRAILPVAVAILAAACATLLPALATAQSCPLAPLLPCATTPRAPTVAPDGKPAETSRPAPARRTAPPPLAIGLTETDARLLEPTAGMTRHVAAKVVALKPNYVRVLVPWERLQPRAGPKPNWDAPPGGCPKLVPRCSSELGLRGLLQTIKRRQETDGGWKILVVPYFTPSWAASPFTGCQKARSRHPRAQLPRIAAYRTFLRGLNALGDKVGVKIDYITPWNEPNHPGFLQPQRAKCDKRSKAISPLAYARLVRAAKQELRYEQTLVLGSLAGLEQPRVFGAGAPEFIRGLPRDVACLEGPFAQHAYIGEPGRRGRAPLRANPAFAAQHGLVEDVLAALDAKGCRETKQLWMAETGTFDHRCEAMSAALRSWALNDRIDAAFQYTFREARSFPVGLVSSSLLTMYPSYRAWFAFAGGPAKVPPSPC